MRRLETGGTAIDRSMPIAFSFPPYVGSSGWVGIRFAGVDAVEMHELITEAWRMTAPKRLVKTFDEETA